MTAQTILPANTLSSGFDVANSLRFNDGSSDYLNRTTGTATSTTKMTFSTWVKRSKISASVVLFSFKTDGNNELYFRFMDNDTLQVYSQKGGTKIIERKTDRVFRDASAWYHLVLQIDTTHGNVSDRIRIYVNGVQETSFSTETNPDQNETITYVANATFEIGRKATSTNLHMDGYLAETVFLDGLDHASSFFGEFDEDTGIWKPKNVSGFTFGNNGFYLQYKEIGTDADASGIGADTSGETNHFTVNNLTAVDQSTDTCTNNFCVMNPNDNVHGGGTFAEGNLQVTTRDTGYSYNTGTFGVAGGKWYWEVKWSAQDTGSTNQVLIGVAKRPSSSTTDYLGVSAWGYGYQGSNGHVLLSNSNLISYTSYSVGDIVGVALDMDNNRLYFSKNGTYNNSSDPANGTNPISITAPDSTNADSGFYFPAFGDGNNNLVETGQFNFGGGSVHAISSGNADANGFGNFEYAVPSGYLALCTKNLAENS